MECLRPLVAMPFLVVMSTLPACSHDTLSSAEATDTTSSAITGGQDDRYDDPQQAAHASVVVRLGGLIATSPGHTVTSVCTGTLLTPTTVLTAGHCYYGFLNDPNTNTIWGNRPPVSVSTTTPDLDPSFTMATNGAPSVLLTNSNCCSTPSDAADDLAIYYLDTDALSTNEQAAGYLHSQWKVVLEAERGGTTLENDTGGRASLVAPPLDSSNQLQVVAGVSGYDPNFVFRQVRYFSTGVYEAAPLWTIPPGGVMGRGDSGGPLFQVRADGSREAFGVHSFTLSQEGFAIYDAWVDITRTWTTASGSSIGFRTCTMRRHCGSFALMPLAPRLRGSWSRSGCKGSMPATSCPLTAMGASC